MLQKDSFAAAGKKHAFGHWIGTKNSDFAALGRGNVIGASDGIT
jgi:hypothetical protein